jgi:hypothetical protein
VSGETIPGFELARVLGEGSHGRVWLARETDGLRRLVALKVFSRENRAHFERELDAARRVEEIRRRGRASELVQALGSGEAGDVSWIALEYLEGGSLAEVVARDGPLPVEAAVAAARDVARALVLLHAEGIFHRDVKPGNVLVGSDGRVRLGDFGLARALDGTLTAAGSPAFAAPEVIAGKLVSGRQADVYSLGATLIFLLTGETILPGRPDLFALERKGVPRPLQQALVAATAAAPEERLATVEELALRLDTRIEEKRRTKSEEGDVSLEERENMVQAPAAPRVAPRRSKEAVASLVCAVLVLPLATALSFAVDARPPAGSTAAVVVGILRVFLMPFPVGCWILAYILGFHARVRIRRSAGALTGKGFALAGLIVACVNLVVPVLAILTMTARPVAAPDLVTVDAVAATGTSTKLPFVPYAEAGVGDWAVYVVHEGSPNVKVNGHPLELTRTILYSVKEKSAPGDALVIEKTERRDVEGDSSTVNATEEVSTAGAPSVAHFIDVGDTFLVKDWTLWKDVRHQGGSDFPCQHLRFVADEGERGHTDVSIWFSPRVKGPGFLAWTRSGNLGGLARYNLEQSYELVGYGTREKTLWGKTFAELTK